MSWIIDPLCRIALGKKLFCANEILQGSILKLRQLIEQNGSGCISLLRIEPGVTYSLDEFVKSQALQIDSSCFQLCRFREGVVSIVEETCMVCYTQFIAHCLCDSFPIFISACSCVRRLLQPSNRY